MNSIDIDKGKKSNLVCLNNVEKKPYFDCGGIRGKGTGLRFGNMTKQTQTSHHTTAHCALGATGLPSSSLWMWEKFPLCPQPGVWWSSSGYGFCFPTSSAQRNSCALADGSSFGSGNRMVTQEVVSQFCLLPKLAWTFWEMFFLVRSRQVTDFRLQSHCWNCEHWLSCRKINKQTTTTKKLQQLQ